MAQNEANIVGGAEDAQLWRDYAATRSAEAKERLIMRYLPLVKRVVGRLAIGLPPHVDRDDLLSDGFLGLLEAVERFDCQRQVKFETYAVARIRGAVLDALRARDWLPPAVRHQARRYQDAVQQLEGELGRAATDQELAAHLSLTEAQVRELQVTLEISVVVPLDETGPGGGHTRTANPLQLLEDAELRDTLQQAIDRLPEKERLVVSLYYYHGLTLKEISMVLKLSEARISQLHTKAVFRLRGALARFKTSLL